MNQAQKIFIDYRKKLKLTQDELAKVLGTTQGTISKIERGDLIPRSDLTLKILAKQQLLKKAR